MVIYVAFIAICNIGLGFALALWMDGPCQLSGGTVGSTNVLLPAVQTQLPVSTSAADCAKPDSRTNSIAAEVANASSPATRPKVAQTWDQFTEQLHGIKDRSHYVRSVGDNRLARDVVKELLICLTVWHDRLLARLEDVSNDALELPQEWETNTIEMVAAQLESSVGNIQAIDGTEVVETIVAALDREFELLDAYRRKVIHATE